MLDEKICERARLARDPRFDGKFYMAVTTTGIYCRPICPAAPSPKSSNVRYYPSAAAAAEAGFRPCLRCRPEASPGTPAWNGAVSSVSRALRLISEGALDERTVDELAARLGIGSRHLRRLFLRYLGATPMGVAQTRRVHFAKRLMDETSLPLTRVAMASGFASIRRFNATFRNLYGRSPRDLRRESKRHPVASANAYSFRLAYRPPFDWDGLIAFLAPRATPGVESVTAEEYRRTISLDGQSGAIAVRPSNGALDLTVEFPNPATLLRIIERVRRIFDLGADKAEINARLKKDQRLRGMTRARPGLRVPGCWDGFEISVRAILGQQVSVKGATTLAGRLVSAFGASAGEGKTLFPAADALADAGLEKIGLTRQRARSIRSLSERAARGEIIFDGSLDDAEFQARLLAIEGVGPWTAQYIAMRMGEPDAFPSGDLHLRSFAKDSEKWRPWRAYAAMHIWMNGHTS